MVDAISWYLLLTLVGLLALPVAYRMLPHLSDRGYIFGRAIGLLLWGFFFWLLTSLGLLQNNSGGVLAALLLLGLLGLVIGRGTTGWRNVFDFLRTHTRLVVITEILFLAAFLFALVMRAGYPDIANTEKPMELAFINSILRSPQFPPNDPWLSGYAISYYYFGYVLVSMLIRLTGVASGVGFNLAISSMFALTALGAYGVAYSLFAGWSRYRQSKGKPGIFAQGWSLLAPLFVLIVSNLEGFLEILHKNGLFWELNGASGKLQSGFWIWLGLPDLNQAPPLPPAVSFPLEITRSGWWWWRASRVIQDTDLGGGYHEVIDEFPFFTYFLADLHPHVLAMPFVLLATALALNLYLGFSRQDRPAITLPAWIKTPDFWFTAVVLGSLAFLNTWDFPIYLALFSGAYTLVRFRHSGWKLRILLKDFILIALVTGAAGFGLYLPFYFGFSSQAGGILPSLSFFSRGVHFWIMFAPFLIPIFAFLGWMWKEQGSKSRFAAGLKFGGLVVGGLWVGSYLLGILAVSLPSLGKAMGAELAGSLGQNFIQWGQLFGGLQGASDGAFLLSASFGNRLTSPGTWLTLLAMITLVWGMFGPEKKPSLAVELDTVEIVPPVKVDQEVVSPLPFVLLLILVGAGLTLAPEFIYLRDQFGGRMNTIFKLYFQTWIVWGVAAAFASAFLFIELRRFGKILFGAVFGVILAAALIYPLNGIAERLGSNQMDWSLNGTAYLEKANPDEMAAIEWLRQAPLGTVAEAIGGQYSEYGRVSMLSGTPTVLGWPGHESQWRGGAKEIGSREPDIDRLYRSSDWNEALNVIQTYGIRYIFIGNLERTKYRAMENKFKNHLAPVFSQGNAVIYEVPGAILDKKP
jgi:YYY domain-containing protein